MEKIFIVYSRKIAYKLMQLGFKPKRVNPNKKYPQYNVYVFDETCEFLAAYNAIVHSN